MIYPFLKARDRHDNLPGELFGDGQQRILFT
jgi:hypothetical protein